MREVSRSDGGDYDGDEYDVVTRRRDLTKQGRRIATTPRRRRPAGIPVTPVTRTGAASPRIPRYLDRAGPPRRDENERIRLELRATSFSKGRDNFVNLAPATFSHLIFREATAKLVKRFVSERIGFSYQISRKPTQTAFNSLASLFQIVAICRVRNLSFLSVGHVCYWGTLFIRTGPA